MFFFYASLSFHVGQTDGLMSRPTDAQQHLSLTNKADKGSLVHLQNGNEVKPVIFRRDEKN